MHLSHPRDAVGPSPGWAASLPTWCQQAKARVHHCTFGPTTIPQPAGPVRARSRTRACSKHQHIGAAAVCQLQAPLFLPVTQLWAVTLAAPEYKTRWLHPSPAQPSYAQPQSPAAIIRVSQDGLLPPSHHPPQKSKCWSFQWQWCSRPWQWPPSHSRFSSWQHKPLYGRQWVKGSQWGAFHSPQAPPGAGYRRDTNFCLTPLPNAALLIIIPLFALMKLVFPQALSCRAANDNSLCQWVPIQIVGAEHGMKSCRVLYHSTSGIFLYIRSSSRHIQGFLCWAWTLLNWLFSAPGKSHYPSKQWRMEVVTTIPSPPRGTSHREAAGCLQWKIVTPHSSVKAQAMGSQNGSPTFAPLVTPVSTVFKILGQYGDRPLSLMRRTLPEELLPYQSILFHASDPLQLPKVPWLPSDVQASEGETVLNPRKPPAGLQVSSPDRETQLHKQLWERHSSISNHGKTCRYWNSRGWAHQVEVPAPAGRPWTWLPNPVPARVRSQLTIATTIIPTPKPTP